MAKRVDKLAPQILKCVANIIQFELKNVDLPIVSVTDIELNDDLLVAIIYVNFLCDKEKFEYYLNNLNHASPTIRQLLAKKIYAYKTPKLIFKLDNSMENYRKINELLKG